MGNSVGIISKHRNNTVVLLNRGDSPKIYCRVKVGKGGWNQKSTDTTDVDEALKCAFDWQTELEILQRNGLSTKRRTFASVAKLYLKDLEDEVRLGAKNERNVRDYKSVLDRYLVGFFGKRYMEGITVRDIDDYKLWRADYWTTGPGSKSPYIIYMRAGKTIKRPRPKGGLPSNSAQNTENVVLRGVFNAAIRHGILHEAQVPTIGLSKLTRKQRGGRRSWFTKAEYEQLLDFLFEWHREEGCRNADRRWLLYSYVQFLLFSGIRPGTEADNLCFKHIEVNEDQPGKKYIIISVNGKTGPRKAIGNSQAHIAVNQIRINLFDGKMDAPQEMKLFSMPDGTHVKNSGFARLFTQALEASGLLYDDQGVRRCLYSLRHTYCTNQLLFNDLNIHTLAAQIGSSVQMIERHYSHLTPELAAKQITDKTVDDFLKLQS